MLIPFEDERLRCCFNAIARGGASRPPSIVTLAAMQSTVWFPHSSIVRTLCKHVYLTPAKHSRNVSFEKGTLSMSNRIRNSLAGAYEAAYQAADIAADITLVLDIASERPQPAVTAEGRQKLQNMFREAREALAQAEQEFEKALDAQPPLQPAVQHVDPTRRARRAWKGRAA